MNSDLGKIITTVGRHPILILVLLTLYDSQQISAFKLSVSCMINPKDPNTSQKQKIEQEIVRSIFKKVGIFLQRSIGLLSVQMTKCST